MFERHTGHHRVRIAELLFRASYYRWSAARGHAIAGRDPVTGAKRRPIGDAESIAAYKAMARVALAHAREYRRHYLGCDDCGTMPAPVREIPADSDGGFGSPAHKRRVCARCAWELALEEE